MSELERLIEIARLLPPGKVQALLAVAEQMASLSDEEFRRKIDSAPPIEIDDETAAELRAALAEVEPTISHEDLKRELGLE